MRRYPAILTAAVSVAVIGTFAHAEGRQRGFREPPAEVKAAFQACAAQAGVSFGEGQRPELTDDQKQQLRSCLEAKGLKPPREGRSGHREGFAKMKQCLADAGVTLPEHEPGERPRLDDATRAAMRACRERLKPEDEQPASDASGVSSSAL